ncbi:MAG: hypothetical protein EOO21_01295, partial [Comamonadaceae bacterium]
MKIEKLMLGLVAAAALTACSSTKLEEPAPVETKTVAPPTSSTGADSNANSTRPVTTVSLDEQLNQAVSNQRVVYFDFDSFVVKDDYRTLIDNHAKRLNNKKTLALSL